MKTKKLKYVTHKPYKPTDKEIIANQEKYLHDQSKTIAYLEGKVSAYEKVLKIESCKMQGC